MPADTITGLPLGLAVPPRMRRTTSDPGDPPACGPSRVGRDPRAPYPASLVRKVGPAVVAFRFGLKYGSSSIHGPHSACM